MYLTFAAMVPNHVINLCAHVRLELTDFWETRMYAIALKTVLICPRDI